MKKNNKKDSKEETLIKGLSKKEMKVISELEFNEKNYFTREEIRKHFKRNKEMTNTLHGLVKKERVVRLNKNKYFLVPLKARSGKWTDEPFIVIDETMDGEGYYIGGWGAANYWRLTDQIPFRYDVYTTRRQGEYKILGIKTFFHRTTKENILKKTSIMKIQGHDFKIMNKKESKKWMKLRA